MADGTARTRRAEGPGGLDDRIRSLGPWFHNLDLQGHPTAPNHALGDFLGDLWRAVAPAFPPDMTGMSVLDVGCNAGFYSFKLHERGARVVGVDHDPRYLAQAQLAAEVRGAEIDFRLLDAYDLDRLDEVFDFVLFMGVLYHLRHPLLALEKVARRFRRRLVVQSLVRGARETLVPPSDLPFEETAVFDDPRFPALFFVEERYAGDPTNWFIPNESGLAAMIRSCDLRVEHHAGPGIYFCAHRER